MSFEHPRGNINKNKVLEVILRLKYATPRQITLYLRDKSKSQISERAVYSALKKLVKEGKVVNDKGVYSIVDIFSKDIRLFGNTFLKNIFGEMFFHKPINSSKSGEHNMKYLIQFLGSYLVYCFIEASRPIYVHSSSMSNNEKDRLAITWVEEAVNLLSLYMFFHFIARNQVEYSSVKKVNPNERPIDTLNISLGFFSNFKRTLEYTGKGIKGESNGPYCEMGEEMIKNLMKNFSKASPFYMDFQRGKFLEKLVRPKEQSLTKKTLESRGIKKREWRYYNLNTDQIEFWD